MILKSPDFRSLDLLFVWEPEGELVGVALAIPCPSQVTEGLEQFSADFWHDIRVELRRRLGDQLQVLPICSAAGDQSPHLLLYAQQEEEMRRRRGLTEREDIAQRVANAVLDALEWTQPEPERAWPLAHRVKRISLTPRRTTRAERDWAQAAYEESAAQGDIDSWWPQRLRGVVEHFDGIRPVEPVPVEIHVLRVGGNEKKSVLIGSSASRNEEGGGEWTIERTGDRVFGARTAMWACILRRSSH